MRHSAVVLLDARLRRRLAALEAQGLTRSLPPVGHRSGVQYSIAGRPVVGFCANDYLGLSRLIAPIDAPAGSMSSRLICGDLDVHRAVERRLATLSGTEDAVLFPSGFQLNVGVLPSILSAGDVVYSDAFNHASIIDGLRLAEAHREILPHRTAPPRRALDTPGALRWWVTESVFSMDGDVVAQGALQDALDDGFCVYLDDAHGFGLYDGGYGWPRAHGLSPTLYVGTLSKALGCAGAFVAASATACSWIRTRTRSFVFSTGTSPRVAASILAGLDLLTGPEGDLARARLRRNLAHLASALRLDAIPQTPIVPIVLGDNRQTTHAAAALLDRGWHVQPIRPPTVPTGTARLRLTLSADHTPAQIDGLVAALREVIGSSDNPFAASLTP